MLAMRSMAADTFEFPYPVPGTAGLSQAIEILS
jgi:hypothetical protein